MASVSSFLICAFCLLPFALIALAAQTQRPPVFRAGAVLVTVDAYPQVNGKIVEGLAARRLRGARGRQAAEGRGSRVHSRGAGADRSGAGAIRTPWPRPTRSVGDPKNRVFVAYLDTYHVGGRGLATPRASRSSETLNRMLAPGDLFGVMTPAMRPSDIAFSRKIQTVEEQLTKYWPWGERFSMMHDAAEDELISASAVRRRATSDGAGRCGHEGPGAAAHSSTTGRRDVDESREADRAPGRAAGSADRGAAVHGRLAVVPSLTPPSSRKPRRLKRTPTSCRTAGWSGRRRSDSRATSRTPAPPNSSDSPTCSSIGGSAI